MDDRSEDTQSIRTDNKSMPSSGLHKSFWFLLVIILIAAGIYGGYWYGHKSQKVESTSSTSNTTKSSIATVNTGSQAMHFVESVGYPLPNGSGTNKYQFVTKLGLPSFLQGVRVTSTIQNQGEGSQIFTDGMSNNELGRWELGNSSFDQDNGSGTAEISLLAISDTWLASTGTTDWQMPDWGSNNPLETPTQKQQYMSQLESSTATCAKDPSKGFSTKDGSLKVCFSYSYGHGAYGVYDPVVILIGYGDIDNQPVVLTGLVNIYDPSLQSASAAERQKTNTDATNGNVPPQTAQAQKAIITVLEQSTIMASANPNVN